MEHEPREMMRKALEAVQWCYPFADKPNGVCPECHNFQWTGHEPECLIGKALAASPAPDVVKMLRRLVDHVTEEVDLGTCGSLFEEAYNEAQIILRENEVKHGEQTRIGSAHSESASGPVSGSDAATGNTSGTVAKGAKEVSALATTGRHMHGLRPEGLVTPPPAPSALSALAQERDAAKAEAEGLREIVAKLPKTKDGVPIVPGIEAVFHPEHGEVWVDEHFDVHPRASAFETISNDRGGRIKCCDCYSTKQAALAAKAAGGKGGGR